MGLNIRKEGEPHPHAKRNFDEAKNIIKMYAFDPHNKPGQWVFKICDYDALTNIIKECKSIGFHGDHEGRRHGFNVSFHQDTAEFDKEFGEVIRMLVQCGYIEKRKTSLV